MIHPVVAGAGERLFGPEEDTARLMLVDHVVTPCGNAVLTRARRD